MTTDNNREPACQRSPARPGASQEGAHDLRDGQSPQRLLRNKCAHENRSNQQLQQMPSVKRIVPLSPSDRAIEHDVGVCEASRDQFGPRLDHLRIIDAAHVEQRLAVGPFEQFDEAAGESNEVGLKGTSLGHWDGNGQTLQASIECQHVDRLPSAVNRGFVDARPFGNAGYAEVLKAIGYQQPVCRIEDCSSRPCRSTPGAGEPPMVGRPDASLRCFHDSNFSNLAGSTLRLLPLSAGHRGHTDWASMSMFVRSGGG
jgi:hypothetical protein